MPMIRASTGDRNTRYNPLFSQPWASLLHWPPPGDTETTLKGHSAGFTDQQSWGRSSGVGQLDCHCSVDLVLTASLLTVFKQFLWINHCICVMGWYCNMAGLLWVHQNHYYYNKAMFAMTGSLFHTRAQSCFWKKTRFPINPHPLCVLCFFHFFSYKKSWRLLLLCFVRQMVQSLAPKLIIFLHEVCH